jgi:hypothetical protein
VKPTAKAIKKAAAALAVLDPKVAERVRCIRDEMLGRLERDREILGRISFSSNIGSNTVTVENAQPDAFYPGQDLEAVVQIGPDVTKDVYRRVGSVRVIAWEYPYLIVDSLWSVGIPAITSEDLLREV